jgi:TolA-binding protein
MTRIDRSTARGVRLALAAATLLTVASAPASRAERRETTPPRAELADLARDFEWARTRDGAERLSALEPLEARLTAVMREDASDEKRAALRLLESSIAFERGDFEGARRAADQSLDRDGKGPFGDDAAFASIRALEAQGRDAEAAKAWLKWERSYPKSPLLAEVRLARSWNALRRGAPDEATKILESAAKDAPWTKNDARHALARAAALYLGGAPQRAIASLGPKPDGAAASYLLGLCHASTGSLLRAAAAFQEVADRWPSSPLADAARLAKANAFLMARDDRSAASEFARAAARMRDPALQAEAELRMAGAVFLSGRNDSALTLLRGIAERRADTDVGARAQFLIGEVLVAKGNPADAILEFNRVLARYFKHAVAASAQYRVARCLDQLGRKTDATGSYEAVVRGYPLEPEAPAAGYLAGVGLLAQGRPLAAAPYFQLVIDRYASRSDARGFVVFASPEHQELVEAALCLLELSYHRAGDLGQLSGAPHLLLRRMPPSRSPWRAYAMLFDADAAASQGRFPETEATLDTLLRAFSDRPIGARALKLLAWTYAQQHRDSLAIATEERLLARHGANGDEDLVAGAMLDIAHERFNQKRYRDAAAAYEDFLTRHPTDPRRMIARYQAGLCYLRLDRAGDAVDRWEAILRDSADANIAERTWVRAGDLYFQAARYADAERCYRGLLDHFAGSTAASLAMLRLAQCEYNAGHDAVALERFSSTIERYPGTPAAREAQRGSELALYRLSQRPGGEKQLAMLVEKFPTSAFAADAQFKLARSAYDGRRWAEAAESFRRVVSQFPSYSAADQAQFLLADATAQDHRAEEARLAYEQFVSFFPSSPLRPTVRFRLGLMDFEAKEYARAMVSFTAALEDSASTDVIKASRYNLALCERMLGQADTARVDLERYASLYPGDARAADIALQLGDLDETAGDLTAAARRYEQALASRPNARLATEIQYRLGHCREQASDLDGALRAYAGAAAAADRDDPFRLSAVARCAALYERRHQYTRALEAYRDLIRNASDRELIAAATDRATRLERTVHAR